jgi:hypothetical protein
MIILLFFGCLCFFACQNSRNIQRPGWIHWESTVLARRLKTIIIKRHKIQKPSFDNRIKAFILIIIKNVRMTLSIVNSEFVKYQLITVRFSVIIFFRHCFPFFD